MPRLLKVLTGLAALVCLAALPASASALPGAHVSATKFVKHVDYPGTQHLHYEYGPIDIARGRTTSRRTSTEQAEGLGLHHALQAEPRLLELAQGPARRRDPPAPRGLAATAAPTFAAGEEKTTAQLPRGYGYHYNTSDSWIMNYMLHNLTPKPTKVSIIYDIDFVPDTAPPRPRS